MSTTAVINFPHLYHDSTKADKVSSPTSGNFAALDQNGNLTDSGHKHSDYLTSHQDISGKINEPSSDGTNGQVLTTNGNGGRSWTTIAGLPSVTSSDNGKFLQVSNGAWAAVTVPNANGVSF